MFLSVVKFLTLTIFVLCLFMVLVNGSYYRRIHQNVDGLRKLLSGLIHPKPNSRYHHHHPGRVQNSHLHTDEFTRPYDEENYIPSNSWDYGLFDPMSFYEQSFDSESQELDDNSLNSGGYSDFCDGYDKNDEYNVNYDNGHKNPDDLANYRKLKYILCNSKINKPEDLYTDFIEKDKQNIYNKKENTYSDNFPNANIDSHFSNELKTNNARENAVFASRADYGDSSDVNLNRNPNHNIANDGIEQAKENKEKLYNTPSLLLDSPGNNQDRYAVNTTPIPSLLPFNYPAYLSNLFVPNISPIEVPVSNNVHKIPTTLNMLNNDAQYSYQPKGIPVNSIPNFNMQLPETIVPNDNIMIPNPNIAFTNVAIPNYVNSGTIPSLEHTNSIYYQNPYSDQQFLYMVQLKNGQNVLLPAYNGQMFEQNNRRNLAQEDSRRLISGYDIRTHVPSNSKYLPPTQGFVPYNQQHIAPNDFKSQALHDFRLGNSYENGQIIVPANTQGVPIEDKNLVQFKNVFPALSSSSNNNSTIMSKDEQVASPSEDKNKKDDNDNLIFL